MSKAEALAQLYGKDPQREHIKTLLTSDNVLKKGELYDYSEPWSTTKADDYQNWKGSKPQTSDSKQDTLKSNISFGSYAGKSTSVQNSDYRQKEFSKVTSFKPANNINIIDLDAKYQADQPKIASSYADEFDKDTLAKHASQNKVVIHGAGNPITSYLRATHFSLGSDDVQLKTEAQSQFSGVNSIAANKSVAAERAQLDKRTNHVFRGGDYNMTKEPDQKSVFSTSYAGITTRQKGYDHIINSRSNVKMDDVKVAVARKLYAFLREKFQNPRDPCQVNLRQAFALFDKKRTGFISYDALSSVLKRLLDPSEQALAGEIISLFDQNNDGKIDYLEFESFLNQKFPPVDKESSLYSDTYKPSLIEGAARPRSSENAVDGAYQIKTHFRFGETNENQKTLYESTFGESGAVTGRPTIARPPPPSQMLPVEPDHMTTSNSIQREDYGNYGRDLTALANERAHTINTNKSLHENASFRIGADTDIDQEIRMKSLSSSSYQPKQLPVRGAKAKGFESQWNHLKTEDAMPELTAGPMISEAADAYNPSNFTLNEFTTNKNMRLGRVYDEKTSHLSFGNDSNSGQCTEMGAKFGLPRVNPDCPAAGIKGAPIAEHQHIRHSEEHSTLSDPSVKSLQDAIKQTILEKCYNPRDPLNVNLQKAFKEFDKGNTGKITVTGLREACKRLQLPVSDYTLHRFFLTLDKNGDGSIDYNEFADELGIHITHISKKGPLTTVMKSDYTPIHERGNHGMEMEFKKEEIHPSHYFHMSHTSATPKTTTQYDFSLPIDKFDGYQTVGSK